MRRSTESASRRVLSEPLALAAFAFDCFISHRWEDSDTADWVEESLLRHSLRVSMDGAAFAEGNIWDISLCENIAAAPIFCPVITINAVESLARVGEDSVVDSLLLEIVLGLALHAAGRVFAIAPLLLGEGGEGDGGSGGGGAVADLLRSKRYRKAKRMLQREAPRATLTAADKLLRQAMGSGLPPELADATVRELLLGREASERHGAVPGILTMDVCSLECAAAGRDAAFDSKYVRQLMALLEQAGAAAGQASRDTPQPPPPDLSTLTLSQLLELARAGRGPHVPVEFSRSADAPVDIFLSYQGEDTGEGGDLSAFHVRAALEARGFSVFLGEQRSALASAALMKCRAVVALCSPRYGYTGSPSFKELAMGVAMEKFLVPLWHSGPYPPNDTHLFLAPLPRLPRGGVDLFCGGVPFLVAMDECREALVGAGVTPQR